LHPDCAGDTANWEEEQAEKKMKSVTNSFRGIRELATTLGLTEEQIAQAFDKAKNEPEREDVEMGSTIGMSTT